MRHLFIVFALTVAASAQAATDCILEMNGAWALNPEKSLDPEGLQFEVLVPSPDFPWSKAANATVAISRLGDKSEFVTQKEDGALTMTYTRVLADDDQTMISVGRDAAGKIIWVRVFDREN